MHITPISQSAFLPPVHFNLMCLTLINDQQNGLMCVSRFKEAWALCKSGGSEADWAEIGRACLIHMEVELAIQIYRMSGNVGMVLSLQSIQVRPTPPIRYLRQQRNTSPLL